MALWPHPDLTWPPRPDAASQDVPSQRLWGPEKCPSHPQLRLCGMKRFRRFAPSLVTGWQRRPGGNDSPASKDMQGRDEMKAPASDPRASLSGPLEATSVPSGSRLCVEEAPRAWPKSQHTHRPQAPAPGQGSPGFLVLCILKAFRGLRFSQPSRHGTLKP